MGNIFDDVLLFHNLPLNGLAALAQNGRERTFDSGEVLMRQGEPSDSMYVIVQGRVGVDRSHPALLGPVRLAELGAGETVGEMGLLDGEPRSATVTALEETRVLELTADVLAETLIQFPEVTRTLLHILSNRIRSTDALVADAVRRRQDAAR
jgi:CRP-like cAMP-binding protein